MNLLQLLVVAPQILWARGLARYDVFTVLFGQ